MNPRTFLLQFPLPVLHIVLVTVLPLRAEQLVLDDGVPANSSTGSWTASSAQSGYFGTGYSVSATTNSGPSWTWQTYLGTNTSFSVSIGLPQPLSNRSKTATYTVTDADGSSLYTVDQTLATGWISLGTHRFTTNSPAVITLTNQNGDGYVVADAVRFQTTNGFQVTLDDGLPSPVAGGTWTASTYYPNYFGSGYHFASATNSASIWTWSAYISAPTNVNLYVNLPNSTGNRAPAATYTVTDADGSQQYTVDQTQPTGGWTYLGTHSWNSSSPAIITLTNGSGGTYLIADAVRLDTDTPANSYQVLPYEEQQQIWGLGVEIQFDSIGSGNDGLPDSNSSVPNDLTPSEQNRWYQQMLSGFRYCRLAMGLYLRGTDAAQQQIIGRWPGQMQEIQDTIVQSGMEGVEMEYWSPAPAWKSNTSYIGGTIDSTNAVFLNAFGNALVNDIAYLQSNGIPISMWGLQNEPPFDTDYSSCQYSAADYHATFAAVAPKIRAALPGALIHADSWDGPDGVCGQALLADPVCLTNVDAWTYHRIGDDSSDEITNNYNANAVGRPVFSNEFEYLSDAMTEWRLVNTAQSIMNWFVFQNAPTWFWLHGLKPITDSDAQDYGLGFWRPPGDTNTSTYPDLPEGSWTWNPYNWNPISGFVRYLPWDSTRVQVNEAATLNDQRILAWKTLDGRLGVALSNRTGGPFNFQVDFGRNATYEGHCFNLTSDNLSLGTFTGSSNNIVLPPYSIEFWVESTPYYRWCEYYWPQRPEGQQTLPTADPDGDGRDNYAEYVFGGNPTNADSAVPMQQIMPAPAGNGFLLKFLCRTNDPALLYQPEASSDLVHWFSGPGYFVQTATAPTTPPSCEWEWVTCQFVGTLPQSQCAFFRIEVTGN